MNGQEKLSDGEKKGTVQDNGVTAASASRRDGRTISTLALLTLIIGAVLLVLNFFFVTIPSMTDPVLTNIGPFTFRLLFCVSLGLILVGLGDYAFFKADSSFVVGGAIAIALAIFSVLQFAKPSEPADVVARVVVRGGAPPGAAVNLITPQSDSIAAHKEATTGFDTIFVLKVHRDVARELPQKCFRMAYNGMPPFFVNGPKTRLPANIDLLFDFVLENNKLFRLGDDGLNVAVPSCETNAFVSTDISPPPTVAVPVVNNPPNTTGSLGWTYFGNLGTAPNNWSERVYDNQSRAKTEPPQAGDQIIALKDVYLRQGPIACDADGICTQLPALRIIRSGEVLSVNSVTKVMASFWAQVSKH